MNDSQRQFLNRASAEAARVNHPFPQMAACEAALECSWGHSQLACEGNNLFGMKQHVHEVYGTMNLPTSEFQNGQWVQTIARWVTYPDWGSCFADRLATLQRLSNAYPHYKAALAATDARTFVEEVSKTWSTDPNRALKILGVYEEYIVQPAPPAHRSKPMPDLTALVATAASAANPISAIVELGKDLIDKFIPDPVAKAQASAHLLDVQAQLQEAQIDQQNKIIAATSANIQSDHYMQSVRATFCYVIITLIAWNYAICRFFHQMPLEIPATIFGMFTVIMLGFIGIPAGVEMVKQVMGMPGDSQISVMGVKVGNKS